MPDLFEQIIGNKPIIIDGIAVVNGIVPRPVSAAAAQELKGLKGAAWLEYLAKISNYSPSALARRVYGLDLPLDEFAKRDE